MTPLAQELKAHLPPATSGSNLLHCGLLSDAVDMPAVSHARSYRSKILGQRRNALSTLAPIQLVFPLANARGFPPAPDAHSALV